MHQLAKAMVKESIRSLKRGEGFDEIVALTNQEARIIRQVLKGYKKLLKEMDGKEESENLAQLEDRLERIKLQWTVTKANNPTLDHHLEMAEGLLQVVWKDNDVLLARAIQAESDFEEQKTRAERAEGGIEILKLELRNRDKQIRNQEEQLESYRRSVRDER